MSIKYKSLIISISALLFSLAIFHPTLAHAKNLSQIKAEELMEESGLNLAIKSTENQINASLILERKNNPEKAFSHNEQELFTRELKESNFRINITEAIQQQLDRTEIEYLINYFNSDLIKRSLTEDNALTAPNQQKQQQLFFDELSSNPLSLSRTKLIEDLEKASLATHAAAYNMITMQKARIKASMQFDNSFDKEAELKLNAYINKLKLDVEPRLRQQKIHLMKYVYRNFSDNELSLLIKLLNDKKRVKYFILVTDAFANTLSSGISKGLTAVLQHRKNNK